MAGAFSMATSFEISGDTSCTECVAANFHPRAKIRGAALDHAPGGDPVHRLFLAQGDFRGANTLLLAGD
jgi:hypothetical protein